MVPNPRRYWRLGCRGARLSVHEPTAVCIQCGSTKELPLLRCLACKHSPIGDDRARSLIASNRMLDGTQLREVQRRIQVGEPFRPGPERIAAARRILAGAAAAEPFAFTLTQAILLLVGNVILTPALGFAVWYGVRSRPGLGGRQALWLTVPVSITLTLGWVGWRYATDYMGRTP